MSYISKFFCKDYYRYNCDKVLFLKKRINSLDKNKSIHRIIIAINVMKYNRLCYDNKCFLPLELKIGTDVVFPHGLNGIHISGNAVIGNDCVIFQHVTIGSNTLKDSKNNGSPVIGNNVYIGSGAKIIGNVRVGNNCRIGANAIVVNDVPDNSTVVLDNTRVIKHNNPRDNSFINAQYKKSMKKEGCLMKTYLITGTSGFIGSNLAKRILMENSDIRIIGIDNMNDYYDVRLKEYRLKELESFDNFTFIKGDISDKELINRVFAEYKPSIVVNLAAQAGVRYSITNPDVYVESNVIGFYNILEACRNNPVEHLVYASSSSVYGGNTKVPFSTDDKVDNPVSLYAATKKSNELFAHTYSKLYNIPTTGLRFFTVYGPAGRPDMAYFGFTNKLINGETIKIFNYGNCKRDFTYVDDIVEGIIRVINRPPEKKNGDDGLPIPPYAVYNIGNSNPENLLDFVNILQEELVRAGVLPEDYDFEAHKELVPMQAGDVSVTYADTTPLEKEFGFRPNTSLREGLRKFAEWYKEFYMDK